MELYKPYFIRFYETLYDRILAQKYAGALSEKGHGIRGVELWNKRDEEGLVIFTRHFKGNRAYGGKYFYEKYLYFNGLDNEWETGDIDDLSYFKGLVYLNTGLDQYPALDFEQIGDDDDKWKALYSSSTLKKLDAIFREQKCRDIVIPDRVQKGTRDNTAENTSSPVVPALLKSIFTFTYKQQLRTDRGTLEFDLDPETCRITGYFTVFYEDEKGRHPQQPEVMKILGHKWNDRITFDFKNVDRNHLGVMLLELDSTNRLVGDYIVYHNKIPKGRQQQSGINPHTDFGVIAMKESTSDEAREFMDKAKGDSSSPVRVDFFVGD